MFFQNKSKLEKTFSVIAFTTISVPIALLFFFNIESFTPAGYENDIFEAIEAAAAFAIFVVIGSPILSIPCSIYLYNKNAAEMSFEQRKRIKIFAIGSLVVSLIIVLVNFNTLTRFIKTTDEKCDFCGQEYSLRINKKEYCTDCYIESQSRYY